MTAVRLGIVGAGWGANHARVAAELAPAIEVRALCSRRIERVQKLADELGLPASALETDWQSLVARDDVDLVAVTAPDYLHRDIALAAIARGKHVFCEKPLAMSAGQAAEMLAAAEQAGVAHFTGFTWRFAPPFATVRRLQDEGRLGRVRFLDGHFRIGPPLPGKEWQFDPHLRAGGVVGNLGVHLIDLARYLCFSACGAGSASIAPGAAGEEDLSQATGDGWRVWASCELVGRPSGAAPARSDVNDVAWLHLDMAGVEARLQVSQLEQFRAAEPVRVEVHGQARTAIGYANPLFPERQRVGLIERTSQTPEWVEPLDFPGGPPAAPAAALPSGGLLRPTVRHLYESHILPRLTGQGTPAAGTPTFLDGWVAQRVMDAALQSAATGGWARL